MGLVGGDLSVLPREICGSELSRHPGHRNEPVGTCTAHPGVMSQKRNGRRVVEEHIPLPFVEYSQTSHPLSLETSRNVLKPGSPVPPKTQPPDTPTPDRGQQPHHPSTVRLIHPDESGTPRTTPNPSTRKTPKPKKNRRNSPTTIQADSAKRYGCHDGST